MLLFPIAPHHDNRSDAIWNADSASLDSYAVRRHIQNISSPYSIPAFPIQHYVFLAGYNHDNHRGLAYRGTVCFQTPNCMYLISCELAFQYTHNLVVQYEVYYFICSSTL